MVESANNEENVAPKHTQLDENKEEDIELMQNNFTKNLMSPFINQTRSWDDDEHFRIPDELKKGITNELGFLKPSKIQGVAIPIITQPVDNVYHSMIAQSKNGSGKTGAFSIASLLRVDPKNPKIQVLVATHVRELSSQISDVYTKITKFSDISVSNYTATGKEANVIVTTLGKLENNLKGRKKMDLSQLKCFIVDEADVFFSDPKNFESLKNIISKHVAIDKVQFILFSATYPESVKEQIGNFIKEASQIKLEKEQLHLDHIQQFHFKCAEGKKPDFIKEVFQTCSMTQTVIFVNTKDYAYALHKMMRNANLKSGIIFGKMDNEERDKMIEKFRKGEVNVVITTNMLARGIDVPEVQIVINFDVPTMKGPDGKVQSDPENYLHRIGRTGRFGTKGIAISIYNRDIDKKYLDDIMDHYKMSSKLNELKGPEHLKQVLEEIQAADF